jgi:hypothetical protein
MKINVIILLSILIAYGSLGDLQGQNSPKIEFEKQEHDFGTILEDDGEATYDFKFKNVGEAPLVINKVKASCGCTTPKWTREPLPPGSEGFIKVAFNPRNRQGNFKKTITVNSNSGSVTLKIAGNITPHEKTSAEIYARKLGKISTKTNHLSFVKMKENETKTDRVEFMNFGSEPVKVGIKLSPDYVSAKVVPETVMPNQKGYIEVTFDASKAKTYGFKMDRIYLAFEGEEQTNKYSIGISATIEEDFSQLTSDELANAPKVNFDSKMFDFGEIMEGDKIDHTFFIENKGSRDLIIRRIKASCGCTAVTPKTKIIGSGEKTELKIVFNSKNKEGRQNKSITIITNDPKQPTTILRVTGTVKKTS